ncbi:uncharacterized protein LOC107764228 [Nicotiana tabacum]|uniref:Uncharacterized protein LOC107764228 n=1 Tax=Nicotiana tabacum TaxID=4097 RepID=A0A1S3XES5_TOBAC|nr:uncharacterized protein LOC104120072 [Nicotiana tomentosiformis]XP_016438269.1 PREDICTED: uncharacterized protein LOC107764228 [Nicotiana tabacum]
MPPMTHRTITVYLHGYCVPPMNDGASCDAWYRFSVLGRRIRLSGVPSRLGELSRRIYGRGARSAIVGNDIFAIGSYLTDMNTTADTAYPHLLKHYKRRYDPVWEIVADAGSFPRKFPFVASIGRELYVLSGRHCHYPGFNQNTVPRRCGQVYHVDQHFWRIIPHHNDFTHYDKAILLDRIDARPTTVCVFYCLERGQIMFYYMITGNIHHSAGHTSLAVFYDLYYEDAEFWDFNDIVGLDHVQDFDPLISASIYGQPVFRENAFFWLGYDLRVYAYSLDERRWFTSPPASFGLDDVSISPLLLGMRNRRFMAVITLSDHLIAASTFIVSREENDLRVIVEAVETFPILDPNFRLLRAMLEYGEAKY